MRKIIAALLSAFLIISIMLPLQVFAVEMDEAIGSSDGGEYQLTPNTGDDETLADSDILPVVGMPAPGVIFPPFPDEDFPDAGESEEEEDDEDEIDISDGIAETFAELSFAVRENISVRLGADITIPTGESLEVYGFDQPIHIDADIYSIRVDGDLRLNTGASISGTGVDNPVIVISDGGYLTIFGSGGIFDYNATPIVTATGTDTAAVSFEAGSNYFATTGTLWRVCAPDGIGIQSEIDLSLTRCFIEAKQGIVSTSAVDLFLCGISATEMAVTAPEVTADTSLLAPQDASYGDIPQRRISQFTQERTIFKTGEALSLHISKPSLFPVMLSSEGAAGRSEVLMLSLLLGDFNTAAPGAFSVPFSVQEWMIRCGLDLEQSVPYPIIVSDLTIPIYSMARTLFGTTTVSYRFAGDSDSLIFWRSDDEGDTWQDVSSDISPMFQSKSSRLEFYMSIPETPVWIVLEVPRLGESKMLILSQGSITTAPAPGGDRNGGDRGENTLPPSGSDGIDSGNGNQDSGNNSNNTPDTGNSGNSNTGDGDSTDNDNTNGGSPAGNTGNEPENNNSGGNDTAAGNNDSTTDHTKPENNTESGNTANSTVDSEPETTYPPNTDKPVPETPADSGSTTPIPAAPTPSTASSAPSAATADNTTAPTVSDMQHDAFGVTVSGAQLALMIEVNPEIVSFFNGELRVSLSAQDLADLRLGEDDLLTVALHQTNGQSFTVQFALNGEPLTPTGFFEVSLPWHGDAISCESESGHVTEAVLYAGRADFSLTETGTYTLMPHIADMLAVTNPTHALLPTDAPFLVSENPANAVIDTAHTYEDNYTPVILTLLCSLGLLGAGSAVYLRRNGRVRKP
jgi:hypothetical protein